MTILIFIIVLVVLIVVHEFGHFVAAKWAGMRVDEFGLGYPPRALTIGKIGETEYTLNWIPFGGFVKIYGEDALLRQGSEGQGRAFTDKPRWQQALVLVAGIAMNLVLAWLIFTVILTTPHWVSDSVFVGGKSFIPALLEGFTVTLKTTGIIFWGLVHFFVGIFTLTADLSQVSGPVGIAGAVGTATALGWQSLLSLVGVISINLALINIIPIPALDGGRLLFVIIEAVTRRPIQPTFAQRVNTFGFLFLLLLMVVVTLHDVYRLIV